MSRTYEGIMEKAIKLLQWQYKECLDQTGTEPIDDDYLLYFESEEWRDAVGEVNVADVLNYLLKTR